ncbi:MAG: sulfotransferase domain-containing protein [bacterium]
MPKPEDRFQWMIKKLLPKRIKKRVMNAWKLATTRAVVVSYPKSGRTWLRATLTFYYEARYGLQDAPLLEFANLHYLDRRIPRIFFTHDDDPNARPEALSRDKSRYRRKHVLFLVRDPRDVCVSMYFHRKKRDLDLDLPIFDFARGAEGGLRTTIAFLNIWADALPDIPRAHTLSYEAMHAEPAAVLAEALRFLGEDPDPRAIEIAIERARFDKLQAMERGGAFESGRLTPADLEDGDSFKVRRGKVGGYRDYFDESQQKELDALVESSLSPFFRPFLSRH